MTAALIDTSIYSAFKLGTRQCENRRELDAFLASPRLRMDTLTLQTAEFYSYIYQELRSKATPIPTNDMWIAATGLEHGLAV